MSESVFVELKFWLLVTFSLLLPVAIYLVLLHRRRTARTSVMLLGLALVAIAGVDVYLLQSLSAMARTTLSVADDAVFLSEVTVGLYALPALFGGVGVNILSNVLLRHLETGRD